MSEVRRNNQDWLLILPEMERMIFTKLVMLVMDTVSDLLPADHNETAILIGQQVTREQIEQRDQALQRLFPQAYQDHTLDEEFRRYTEAEAAEAKFQDALSVWRELDKGDEIMISASKIAPWLRTITNIRLILHERNQPDLAELQYWLGWLQESLLAV